MVNILSSSGFYMGFGVTKLTFFHTNPLWPKKTVMTSGRGTSEGLILFKRNRIETILGWWSMTFCFRNSCAFVVYDLLFGKNIELFCLMGLQLQVDSISRQIVPRKKKHGPLFFRFYRGFLPTLKIVWHENHPWTGHPGTFTNLI